MTSTSERPDPFPRDVQNNQHPQPAAYLVSSFERRFEVLQLAALTRRSIPSFGQMLPPTRLGRRMRQSPLLRRRGGKIEGRSRDRLCLDFILKSLAHFIASQRQVLGGFSGIRGIWFSNLERRFTDPVRENSGAPFGNADFGSLWPTHAVVIILPLRQLRDPKPVAPI